MEFESNVISIEFEIAIEKLLVKTVADCFNEIWSW